MVIPISDPDLKSRRRPVVNIALIALSAAVFVYELTLGGDGREIFFLKYGLIPAELTQGVNFDIARSPTGDVNIATPFANWITIFTAMFIHADWLHFGFNMLFLWVFGDNVEDRFGHFRYLLFYLASGVAAAWLQIGTDVTSQIPSIGASGAIAGVLGAYLVLYPRSRVTTLIFFIIPVSIPAVLLLGFWFLIQFFSGIGSLGPSAQSGGVAYWAHVGGFVFGVLVALFYRLFTRQRPWPGEPRPPRYWRGRPIN